MPDFKPLSRRLKITHRHFSKSFSPPKVSKHKRVFFSPQSSAGVATLNVEKQMELTTHDPATEQKTRQTPKKYQLDIRISPMPGERKNTPKIPEKYPQNTILAFLGVLWGVFEGVFGESHMLYVGQDTFDHDKGQKSAISGRRLHWRLSTGFFLLFLQYLCAI